MKSQKEYIFNYRVIIKPDKRIGSNKTCYTAICPTLDIADDGDTVEKALKNIHNLIIFHFKCLKEENKEIPVDCPQEELVTNTQIKVLLPSPRFTIK